MHFGEQLVIFLNLMILVYVSNHRFESLTPRAEAHNALFLQRRQLEFVALEKGKEGRTRD